MKKGKILLVRATPGDLDINAYNVQQLGLGKAFCHLGYDYDFITFKKNSPRKQFLFYQENDCQAMCIEVPRKRFLRWGINRDIADPSFLAQYDMIICQEYYQYQTYLMSCNSDKVSMYSGPYYNMFFPKILSPFFDLIYTKKINRQVKHKFVKSVLAYDFLKRKGYTGLINVGVALDTARFDNEDSIKPETRQLIDYMKSNRCILYVGALSDRKNYPFMLKVYEKALERIPDLKFIMIGKSRMSTTAKLFGKKDDDYAGKFYELLPQKVKDGIIHIERLDNPQLKYIYPLAKAFLLPSKLEIFGMVLLEAMYLRTPVISSYNGGSATLIEGRETGQIVKDFDVNQWVEAIERYINNPDYSFKVTKNAETLIRNEYNWESIAKKMLAAYSLNCE